MLLQFSKYHGTGNDFILIDDRKGTVSLSTKQIAMLCHRRFGIGADGLMLLRQEAGYDFRMVYYNSDGGESSMCGNGGRCITAFARDMSIITDEASFVAIDGPHKATIQSDGNISLEMIDVPSIQHHEGYIQLNTGSPHYVKWVAALEGFDVFHEGRDVRNLPQFQPGGINANFVQRENDELYVRTYERGVEDETLSCGTGVTAAAIASTNEDVGNFSIPIRTPGGNLTVQFKKDAPGTAKDVFLIGPAVKVFDGTIEL